jgi:hypothetical protein
LFARRGGAPGRHGQYLARRGKHLGSRSFGPPTLTGRLLKLAEQPILFETPLVSAAVVVGYRCPSVSEGAI